MRILDFVYLVGFVLLFPWLVWRSFRTGRYRRDLRAKLFGTTSLARDHRPIIWFHGVSVGEIHLLQTVVNAFRARHPDWRMVISSTTDTGLAEARLRFADLEVIPFPFDFSWAITRTLQSLQPRLLIVAESELWPNLLAIANERQVPVAVINTRLSLRSFARWSRIRGLARRAIFMRVQLWAVQSVEYAQRLLAMGVPSERIVVTGSIKYDGAIGKRETAKGIELRRLFGLSESRSVVIWVAGSTHAPEESIVLEAFRQLRDRYPQLRLILVPRHPDRFAEVAQLLERCGINWRRRSELSEPLQNLPPILLLDSVGELGAVWGLADVGFTGGSLDGKRGGQSMIEPAGYGVPTIFGPHVWNFRDAAGLLVQAGAAIQIRESGQLVPALAELLADSERRQQMGQIARELVIQQQGATHKTLDALDHLLCQPNSEMQG